MAGWLCRRSSTTCRAPMSRLYCERYASGGRRESEVVPVLSLLSLHMQLRSFCLQKLAAHALCCGP